MKFVNESTVTLLDTNASDEKVARAAWVSKDGNAHEKEAEEGRIEGLIKFLWRNKHTSPFEHGQFTFLVETPLFVAREFHRHRTMSYNEVSGRYSELEPKFYLPGIDRPVVQEGKVGSYQFVEDIDRLMKARADLEFNARCAWDDYQEMLEYGIAREVARMVLPVNLMTSFWATVNPLNLMRFLDLRTDDQAMYEIRDVAFQMAGALQEAMPLTYAAWSEE